MRFARLEGVAQQLSSSFGDASGSGRALWVLLQLIRLGLVLLSLESSEAPGGKEPQTAREDEMSLWDGGS